jgi:PhzF family phenazine biosynthesis protein
MQRRYQQIDVFTATPYLGNALGVVLDGEGLSTAQMQQFTNWTQLSEVTFVLPPTQPSADYRVRIFCPGRELPFAGHPTLGSCHAWLLAGGQPKAQEVVQECGLGEVQNLIRIQRQAGRLAFAAPPLQRSGPLQADLLARITQGLGLDAADVVASAHCNNGPGWHGLLLKSAEQVLAVKPNAALLQGLDVGIVGPYTPGTAAADAAPGCAFEVRAFFPGSLGLAEDPVTGSLNAALAQWLMGAGLAPSSYTASQGTVLGRQGRVHVQRSGTPNEASIWVGGHSVLCTNGTVQL